MPLLTPAELSRFRARADPLADAAVATLEGRPGPNENVLDRVRAAAAAGNAACKAFVDVTSRAPPWADFEAMEPGRRMAMRNAPVTFLVLLNASLIESFAVAFGAKVLHRTGRLERDTIPRLYETAAMVRDVLLEGANRPGRIGHTALLRVRLLHAYVRRFIRANPTWDAATWGQPINQMDMAHTLMMFSLVLARGIGELGVAVTQQEQDSWCHLWRYAGYMLGVEEALLFTSLSEERALYAMVRANHYSPDEISRSLTYSVLDALSGEPPFFLPKQALYAFTRRLVGEDLADGLHLPRSRAWAAVVEAFTVSTRGVDVVQRRAPFAESIALKSGHAFVEFHRWRVLRQGPLAAYVFRTAR